MQTSFSRTVAFVTLMGSALAASAQNIVQDPGFENPGTYDAASDSYDFNASWVATGSERVFKNEAAFPDQVSHSGDYFASLTSNAVGGVLSQDLTTLANRTYTISFYLQNYNITPGTTNSLVVAFGDGTLNLTNVVESAGYLQYSFTGMTTGTSTTLSFTEQNLNDAFFLDDVSTVVNPVPEPASMAALGLGALAVVRRPRRRA